MGRQFHASRILIPGLAAAMLVIAAHPAMAGVSQGGGPVTSGHAVKRSSDTHAVAPAGKHARTVVTFAWGGGWANQMQALPIFREYGMHAVYFIPSGLVCTRSKSQCASSSPYLTLSDIHAIASYGNEIGGLSVLHQDLTQVSPAEAKREICDDRGNLFRWGFRPTDFAYPFAAEDPGLENLTRQCGYNAGLGAGELRGDGLCRTCAWAETIPPPDPMLVRAPVEVNSVKTDWSVRTYQSIVEGAEKHGGGWIFFTLHDYCAKTCGLGITGPQLRKVLAWLRTQARHNVRVETMRQVTGGPVQPAGAGPAPHPVPPPGVVNSRLLRTAGKSASPACFRQVDYGKNDASFTYHPTGGPGGSAAETVRVTRWVSGGAKLLPDMDLGACAPAVSPGQRYTVGAWYKSSQPTQLDVYYRNRVGDWLYWTTSPAFPATDSWQRAAWTTPAVPAAATAMSFGLTADSNITVTSTAYSIAPAKDRRAMVLLGLLLFILVAAALIARGQIRYRKYIRAEIAADEHPGVSA